MTTPNPLAKTKGAGTTFWMYTGNGDAFANPLSDTDWLRLAMVKDLQPGEMTADAEDDTYLDDEDADWKTTTQGQKSVGDTSATLAWRPGDSGQKKLVQLFDSGEVCAFRIKYPNGTVDVFRGWLSSLGKTIASKDVMTRTVKISGVGRPYLAEEGTETVSCPGCRELNIWRLFSSERQSLMPVRENCRRLNDRLLFCGWGWISMPGWFPAHCGMRISLRM